MKYNKIKTFEDACEALGIDPAALPDFSMIPEGHRKALLAHYKLVIIVQALNEGWTPDWSNTHEYKFELWPDLVKDDSKPSGFGLVCHVTAYWLASTSVGSRLCFKSREVARHAFDNFQSLHEDYLLIG